MKNFSFVLKYSFRNLSRNPKRTTILYLALTLSCAMVIWVLNVNRSSSEASIDKVTNQYVGRFQATHPELDIMSEKFKAHKYLTTPLPSEFPFALAPRTLSPVFIAGAMKTVGVMLVGIDPEIEKKLAKFPTSIIQGTFFAEKILNPIILGQKLANRINVKVGDEVVVLGQAIDGSIANDLFFVTGLYDWGGGITEEKISFTILPKHREFLSLPNDSYHLLVGMQESDGKTVEAKGMKVTYWQKIIPDVFVSFDFLGKLNFALTVIMVLVVCLGVTNTLFVSFLERQNELKSLNTIGATSRWIMVGLAVEVYFLLAVALLSGSLIAYFSTLYFNYHPIDLRIFSGNEKMMVGGMVIDSFVAVQNYLESYVKSLGLITFFVSLSMLYPIRKAIKSSKKMG